MTRLPKVAIVGRPNVGKSALFNCMITQRTSIVAEEEGVTRDRLYGTSDVFGRAFEVIDTGGMLSGDPLFGKEICQQAEFAIGEADAIIQVVDGAAGVLSADMEVAKILRRTKKPVALAVNKIDNSQKAELLYAFACLGIQPMIAVSALHRYQIAELLEAVLAKLPVVLVEDEAAAAHPTVAIIGRPNVGKSLLLNAIVGESRCIVSPIAGTTRDSIDSQIEYGGRPYTFVDTAGIRRKPKERDVIEKFAAIRTERAIERADVCLLVIDSQQGVTSEEKKIARAVEDAGKGCVLVLNKWDLISGIRMEHAVQGLIQEVPFLAHCPRLCISAKTGRNIDKLFPLIGTVLLSLEQRISTHRLNKALLEWTAQYQPPSIGGRRLRIYYMSQVDIHPPKFVLFVNAGHLLDGGYRRYLVNQLRTTFQFEGVPFVLTVRGKGVRPRGKSHPGHEEAADPAESLPDDVD